MWRLQRWHRSWTPSKLAGCFAARGCEGAPASAAEVFEHSRWEAGEFSGVTDGCGLGGVWDCWTACFRVSRGGGGWWDGTSHVRRNWRIFVWTAWERNEKYSGLRRGHNSFHQFWRPPVVPNSKRRITSFFRGVGKWPDKQKKNPGDNTKIPTKSSILLPFRSPFLLMLSLLCLLSSCLKVSGGRVPSKEAEGGGGFVTRNIRREEGDECG